MDSAAELDAARRQFLPAALEVQASPPSPAGQWLLLLLVALFAIGLLWACFGEVDVVVAAPGRIVPTGQVKQVQPLEAGSVAAILVAEGDPVVAGQPLIRLDTTLAEADDLRIRQQLADSAIQFTWRRALERWLADGAIDAGSATIPRRFAAADQLMAESLYRQHREEITASLLSLEKELAANRAEQAVQRSEREKTLATLAVLKQRVASYKTLVDQQYGSRVQYLELLQQQTGLEQSIPVILSREHQLRESAAAIAARMRVVVSEQRKRNLLELARLESERTALEQESRKTGRHRRMQLLSAPVSGTVQELAVHTVGGVVKPAQVLMKIVPVEVAMEVKALLRNRDIGFVREGQAAKVKVDTFNFTRYGLIDAEVTTISDDAVQDRQLGWAFDLRLELARDSLLVEGKQVKLSPGMAVTAEIRTGKRRLIEFFLSPLLRYKQESVRER